MAVRQAADIVCDRWALTLLIAALSGDQRFSTFVTSTGMASRLVASRLRALVSEGILQMTPYSERPLRHDYSPTAKGEALGEFMLAMKGWHARWDPGQSTPLERLTAIPEPLRCAGCHQTLTARDVELRISTDPVDALPPKKALHRRSSVDRPERPTILDLFGDKWTIEILICAFMPLRRFGEFREATGIAANILADRLQRLRDAEVLAQADSGYRLTDRGVDLYGALVAVQSWADDWITRRYRSPVLLIHRACGERLRR